MTVLESYPSADAIDLATGIRVLGDAENRQARARRGDPQEVAETITGNENSRRPCAGESRVKPVRDPDEPPRLHQICEEHLPHRIRVGGNDNPQRSKERDVQGNSRQFTKRVSSTMRQNARCPEISSTAAIAVCRRSFEQSHAAA
jgi:hypothetical protein